MFYWGKIFVWHVLKCFIKTELEKKKKKSYLFNELKWYVSLVMFYEMLQRVFNCATDAVRIEKFPVTMFEILTFCR